MAFSDFDLRTAVQQFGLQESRDAALFRGVSPLEPSSFLRLWLDEFAPAALGMNTEKARSEFIIAPVLAEGKRRAAGPITVLSGVAVDADRAKGLTGFCDFVIARSAEFYYLRGPLAAVVEAKREDLIAGLGQCAAAMVGIQVFNERDGTPAPMVYGCVTSGNLWRFLRLEGTLLSIDLDEYHLRDAGTILGILVQIMGGPKKDAAEPPH